MPQRAADPGTRCQTAPLFGLLMDTIKIRAWRWLTPGPVRFRAALPSGMGGQYLSLPLVAKKTSW